MVNVLSISLTDFAFSRKCGASRVIHRALLLHFWSSVIPAVHTLDLRRRAVR